MKYAKHKQSGTEVAIKCIDRINTNPDELVHEAMLMQMVEDHPGIIKIKDVYEDAKLFYLVMELYVVLYPIFGSCDFCNLSKNPF